MGFLRKLGKKIKKGVQKLFSTKLGRIVGGIGLSMAMGWAAGKLFQGAKALFSIEERAHELAECIERRYKKELNAPVWTDEDLEELGPNLQKQIKAKQFLRLEILERLRNTVSVAQGLLERAIPLWND